MAILSNLLFNCAYIAATIGYPGFMIQKTKNNPEKLWVVYFLLFGCLTLLEGTILFPIKYM